MRNYIVLAAILGFALYAPKAAGIALIGAIAIVIYIFWSRHQAAITKAAQLAASAAVAAQRKPTAPRKRKPAAPTKPAKATKSTTKKR